MASSDYTILVVDDDENNRDMLSRRLKRKEYKVLTASDGPEALELAGNIDIIALSGCARGPIPEALVQGRFKQYALQAKRAELISAREKGTKS